MTKDNDTDKDTAKGTERNKDDNLVMCVAVYDTVDLAKADLDAIEDLHKHNVVGKFDAAVVDNQNGKPHIVKRLDRPMVRIIPEELGYGQLKRKELKEAASELTASEAGLIVVGEMTIEKAFDQAATHAAKTLKRIVDVTTDELTREMKEVVGT